MCYFKHGSRTPLSMPTSPKINIHLCKALYHALTCKFVKQEVGCYNKNIFVFEKHLDSTIGVASPVMDFKARY